MSAIEKQFQKVQKETFLGFFARPDFAQMVEKSAKNLGVSKSEFIRTCIDVYVSEVQAVDRKHFKMFVEILYKLLRDHIEQLNLETKPLGTVLSHIEAARKYAQQMLGAIETMRDALTPTHAEFIPKQPEDSGDEGKS